ncbi:C6 zinc finger protein [Plectosphaerella cucumerina]|uniref:C6 zinc finger protein n=1 Tax=Plectosphaerella cucumerina TaxID=40658 RepID=A0A8K0TRA6_9PEZI|nr:C6 zinc finger protein [Plectosphaerella cucumerina]
MEAPRGRNSARRTHNKVRTGCRTCKARKIKCDEQKPSCANCIRYGVSCDIIRDQALEPRPKHAPSVSASPPPTPPTPGGSTTTSTTAPRHYLHHDASSPASPIPAPAPAPAPVPDLNRLDLELMHHWTSSTHTTLTHDPQLRPFWCRNLVAIGLSCDFVMRNILSLSALHLAHLSPEREPELVEKAVFHQQLASKQALAAMAAVTGGAATPPDLADCLFCYSVLTMYIVLSNSRNPEDVLLSGGASPAPDWLHIYSGVRELGVLSRQGRDPGRPVSPIGVFAVRRVELRERARHMPHPYLDHLRANMAAVAIDPALRAIYDLAIDELHASFAIFYRMPDDTPDIIDLFLWMSRIQTNFIPLLKNPSQEALAVFSYFCMLPKKLPRQWWLNRWADSLKIRTYELLDAEHRRWVVEPSTIDMNIGT